MSRKMTKSILSRDEITLFKHSEELKNTELYGNLYDILSNFDGHKAVSIEDLSNLNTKAIAALTYNKKILTANVIKEWFAERTSEEDPTKKVKCGLCNTPNKYLYYIRNKNNNNVLNVGSRCITKFPGITGYTEQKQQLAQIHKGHKIIARRNEFYDVFPNVEQDILDADTFFHNLPILLPYSLYINLKNEIANMRHIFNTYINEGKTPFKSEKSAIELFQISLEQYASLKSKANIFVDTNINNPLICRQRELNWIIKNNKTKLFIQISKNNGIYTLETLKQIYMLDFIRDHFSDITKKNQFEYFKYENLNENGILFSFKKFGYQNSIQFSIGLGKFMFNIGANCIIESGFQYADKEILNCATIIDSRSNLSSVINFIDDIVFKLNCAFLVDDTTQSLILYRRGDHAIRKFNTNSFLHSYSQYILNEDAIIKQYLKLLIGDKNTKWIDVETQEKQGIHEKIRKLYKEYKEIHSY